MALCNWLIDNEIEICYKLLVVYNIAHQIYIYNKFMPFFVFHIHPHWLSFCNIFL